MSLLLALGAPGADEVVNEGRARSAPGGPMGAGAAVAASRVFLLVASAVQLPVLTRLLEPAEYGRVAIAIVVANYFSLVAADPFILSLQRFPGTSSDRSNYRYALVRAITSVGVVALIATFLGLLFGVAPMVVALSGWGIGLALSRLVSTAWLGWLSSWRYAGNLMLSTGARTVLLLVLIWAGVDPLLALACAGIGAGLSAVIAGPTFAWRSGGHSSPPWDFKFGVRLALASLAINLLTSSALLILPFFAHPTEVGRFAAIFQLAGYTCGGALNLVNTVAYPRLRVLWDSGGDIQATRRLQWLKQVALVVGCLLTGLLLLNDGRFISELLGARYADTSLVPSVALAVSFTSMGTLSSWYHQFRLDARVVAGRTLLSALLALVVGLILIAHFGARGAAISAVVGSLGYHTVMTPRHMRRLPFEIVIWGSGLVAALVALGLVDGLGVVALCLLALSLVTALVTLLSIRGERGTSSFRAPW